MLTLQDIPYVYIYILNTLNMIPWLISSFSCKSLAFKRFAAPQYSQFAPYLVLISSPQGNSHCPTLFHPLAKQSRRNVGTNKI